MRIAAVVAVIVIAIVGFIVLKPNNNNSSSSTAQIPNVQVKSGKPVGGIQNLTFNKGDAVKFKVTSDVADEVHVHGYDFHKDVAPGHPVTFSFPGRIDGEFVVELEKRGEQIASLKVNP